MYLEGSQSLIPVPRNIAYSQSDIETNISSEYLRGLIESQCLNIPLDTVEEATDNAVKVTE